MLLRIFLAVAIFSLSLQNAYSQLFDFKSLAMDVADKALQTHSADSNFPIENINIPAVQNYVNQVRSKLDPYAIHKQIPVFILKTARIQGQSVYGQEIDVTRGMLNMISDEAQLACLLGHEIGHADHNDKLDSFKPSVAENIITAGALTAANSAGVGDIAADVNKNRQAIMAAAWSQSLEEAADEYGAVLAAKAGYDPYALCDLFDRLMIKVKATSIDQGIDLTSSHKSFDERAKHLKKYLKDNGYEPGQGFRKQKEYADNVIPLADIHTNEGLTGDQRQDITDLKKINDELSKNQKTKSKLTSKRYSEIMKRFSQYAKKYHITRQQLVQYAQKQKTTPKGSTNLSDKQFMANTVDQDDVFDPNSPNGLGPAGQSFIEGLDLVAHLGLWMTAPEVMVPISAYEAISGRDFFTDAQLSTSQRILSGLGGLVGAAGEAAEVTQSLETLAGTEKAAVQVTEESIQEYQQASNWTQKTAADVNAEFVNPDPTNLKPPYEAGSDVYESTAQQTETFYRVHGPTNEAGDWMVNFDPSKYTSNQLKDTLALKYPPTSYSEVTIPSGTNLRVGTAAPVEGWGKGGGVQWQITDGWKAAGATFKNLGLIK